MSDSDVGSGSPFPSRRSLREAQRVDAERADAERVAPERIGVERIRTAEALTPLPSPAVEEPATPAPAPAWTLRRAIASATAICCAAGLLLAVALPGIGGSPVDGAGDTAEAASLPEQSLASSYGSSALDASLDALGAIDAESDGTPVSFINFTDAAVQFPFAASQPLSDGFGPRAYPVSGFHDAQDFAAPEGTQVQAIARGTVLETGDTDDGCGFGVLLEHTIDGQTVTSRYCHMQEDSNELEVGQEIDVAHPVGRVGATGLAFGAHLHFALTVDDEPVDPLPFLFRYNAETREP